MGLQTALKDIVKIRRLKGAGWSDKIRRYIYSWLTTNQGLKWVLHFSCTQGAAVEYFACPLPLHMPVILYTWDNVQLCERTLPILNSGMVEKLHGLPRLHLLQLGCMLCNLQNSPKTYEQPCQIEPAPQKITLRKHSQAHHFVCKPGLRCKTPRQKDALSCLWSI